MNLTQMTRDHGERFAACFVQTAATKAGTPDDVTIEAYAEELADLPIDAVEDAAARIRRMPQDFLPSAGYWFSVADEIAAQALAAAQSPTEARALPPASDDDELSRIQAAHAAFIGDVRRLVPTLTARAIESLAHRPTRVPMYHCASCRDSGWMEHRCTEDRLCTTCQRSGHPYDHTHVEKCICSAENPELNRQRALARARRQKRKSRDE